MDPVSKVTEDMGGEGDRTSWVSGEKTSWFNAIFANGMLAHSIDAGINSIWNKE